MATSTFLPSYIALVLLFLATRLPTTASSMTVTNTFYARLSGSQTVNNFFAVAVDTSGFTPYGYVTDAVYLWRFNTRTQGDNDVTKVMPLVSTDSATALLQVTPRAVVVWTQLNEYAGVGVFILVDPQTFQVLGKVPTPALQSMTVSPNGEYLYCNDNETVYTFDLRSFSFGAQYPVPSSCLLTRATVLSAYGSNVYILSENGQLCQIPLYCKGKAATTYTIWSNFSLAPEAMMIGDRYTTIGLTTENGPNFIVSVDPCNNYAIVKQSALLDNYNAIWNGWTDRTADNAYLLANAGLVQVNLDTLDQVAQLSLPQLTYSGAYDSSQNVAFVGGPVSSTSQDYFISKILLS